MIILLAMLLAQTAPVAPSPPPSDDIVVVGERLKQLKRLHIQTKIDRKTGATRCVFKRRSGDPRLDKEVCAATLACAATVRTEPELVRCMEPTITALVPKKTSWSANAVTNNR